MLRTISACLLLCIIPHLLHAEDLNTLLSFVPKDANVVMAVDLKALMASPVAAKESWKQKVAEETMIGTLPFPETAEYAVVAELLQPGTLQSKWELVLISTNKPFALADVAKAEKADVETIGTTSVCFTKRNTVILQLSPTLLGIYSPGHRQDVARWLRSQTGKPQLSAPLAAASSVIQAGNHVALIFDFEDTLEAGKVKQFIAAQKEVSEKKLNVDALSKTFSSLKTVTFTIQANQAISGTMKVAFAQDVTQANVMSMLVLNAFEMIGGDVEEYRKGTLTHDAKSFELQTPLSAAGFRNTIGMVQPHSIAPSMAKQSGDKPAADPVKQAQHTFKWIQYIANSAHTQAEASNNIARAMVIYDNAATRLDKLPVAHVEEDIQRFAADVANSLRQMATELNSGVLEVQVLETKIRTDVNVTAAPPVNIFPNPWGFRFANPFVPPQPQYNVQTNQPEVVAAQLDVINRAVRKRNDIWRSLVDKSAALKKTLSAKYGVAF